MGLNNRWRVFIRGYIMKNKLIFMSMLLLALQGTNVCAMEDHWDEEYGKDDEERLRENRYRDPEPEQSHKRCEKGKERASQSLPNDPEAVASIATTMQEHSDHRTMSAEELNQLRQELAVLGTQARENGHEIENEVSKDLLIPANLYLTAESIKSVATRTLSEMCLKNIYQHILTYSPEKLLQIVSADECAIYSDDVVQRFQQDCSRNLRKENCLFFFPSVEGFPKIKQTFRINYFDDCIRPSVFSPDGQRILTASDKNAMLRNLNGDLIATLKFDDDDDDCVRLSVFSPEGQRILTASDKNARLWNLNGDLIATFEPGGYATLAKFSPDGQSILSNPSDNKVRLWNLNGDLITTFELGGYVKSTVFSPDGQRILTNSSDYKAMLWNLNGDLIATFEPGGYVKSTVFSPDGQRILTNSSDYKAMLWNLKGDLIATFEPGGYVNSSVFSPDGKSILTISSDKKARLWNLNGDLITTFEPGGYVNSTVFSPDGQRILTNSSDNKAMLWNLNGDLIATLEPGGYVNSAVFSPDGQSILTDSSDNKAMLWNLNGDLIATFELGGYVTSAVFSPDGKSILTDSLDNKASLWEIHPLWNSDKYLNGNFSLQEFALIILILNYKQFINSDARIKNYVMAKLNIIDGDVPEEQKYIKKYFVEFLKKAPTWLPKWCPTWLAKWCSVQ